MMRTRILFLFAVIAAKLGEGTADFSMSVPYYQDYNKMTTECSFNGSEPHHGHLWCSVDGGTLFAIEHEPLHSECLNITVVADSTRSVWNLSVVLQGCDQVQLRCGSKRADGSGDLSSPVTLRVLERKVRVRVSPSEEPNATDVYMLCETFGIQDPNTSWYIDQQKVYEPVVTMGDWSFAQLNRSSEVAVLDAWHIAATSRLRFSECSENVVTLGCGHKAANDFSEPFLFDAYNVTNPSNSRGYVVDSAAGLITVYPMTLLMCLALTGVLMAITPDI